MQNARALGGGGGGGESSGGSMSTLSREVVSSEESSPYPDDSDLELGLGLSLCGGGRKKPPAAAAVGGSWDQYARILTAKSFSSAVSAKDSSSSSSVPVTKAKSNELCGTKRTAEPSSPPGRSGVGQVVGWPPIRIYRMNSLVNHVKTPASEECASTADACKDKSIGVNKTNYCGIRNKNAAVEKGPLKTSLYVKVNMVGIPIGRKVDLNAHSCYETLAQVLDDMFQPGAAVGAKRSDMEEQAQHVMSGTRRSMKLLDSTSDYVLIYEDKEGDWMLVGDVPWGMFLSSVRRLRIMKMAEANGLVPDLVKQTEGYQWHKQNSSILEPKRIY